MESQTTGRVNLSQRAIWSAEQPIGELMATAIANPQLISLAAGFVDQQSLPATIVDEELKSIFSDEQSSKASLQYGATHGDLALRELILDRLRADDRLPYADLDVERLVLTAGSNQMLHLIADTLLDAGDIVICASPTYLVFLGILEGMGVRSIGVRTDESGIIPESIDELLGQLEVSGELERVKAIYLVSYFDNPMGISTTEERRSEIVQIAQKWSRSQRIHVLEDAAYRELRYSCDDQRSARAFDESGQTVIHTGSFSKSFSPGVRIGWGVLPEELVVPICNLKGNIDFGSPHLNQKLMARVFSSGKYDGHIDSLRSSYRLKAQAMLDACQRHLSDIEGVSWIRPDGGLYVWATLPESIHAGPKGNLFNRAVEEGVLYVPGHYCFPKEGAEVQPNTVRLSFGMQTPERIDQGIAALGRAIRRAIDD